MGCRVFASVLVAGVESNRAASPRAARGGEGSDPEQQKKGGFLFWDFFFGMKKKNSSTHSPLPEGLFGKGTTNKRFRIYILYAPRVVQMQTSSLRLRVVVASATCDASDTHPPPAPVPQNLCHGDTTRSRQTKSSLKDEEHPPTAKTARRKRIYKTTQTKGGRMDFEPPSLR